MRSKKPSYVTDEELIEFRESAKKKVHVSCDENHQHAWECLIGDRDALVILRLCETITDDRRRIANAASFFKTGIGGAGG
jgi:hypothetical protein